MDTFNWIDYSSKKIWGSFWWICLTSNDWSNSLIKFDQSVTKTILQFYAINRLIESQDFRDGQSFNKTKLILDTNERIDQLIELLKKQKQYMPVWNIRKLVYGFFGEKVKDMSLFDLIEEHPFDMIIVHKNINMVHW